MYEQVVVSPLPIHPTRMLGCRVALADCQPGSRQKIGFSTRENIARLKREIAMPITIVGLSLRNRLNSLWYSQRESVVQQLGTNVFAFYKDIEGGLITCAILFIFLRSYSISQDTNFSNKSWISLLNNIRSIQFYKQIVNVLFFFFFFFLRKRRSYI